MRRFFIVLAMFVLGTVLALVLEWSNSQDGAAKVFSLFPELKPQKEVVGFLPYWLLKKANQVSLKALTQITYFGLELSGDGSIIRNSTETESEPGWYQLDNGTFSSIADTFPSTKRSLLIHQTKVAVIDELLSDATASAKNLVSVVEPVMKEQHFTDLNLDIETFQEASPEARQSMTIFLRTVKGELQQKKLGTLTVELTVRSLISEELLDPVEVGEIADFVVLMAYDYRYVGSYLAGAVAPMGGAGEVIEYGVPESVELAVHSIPPEKLMLGIPLYGYEWETLSYDPGSPVIPGTGKTATLTRVAEELERCRNKEKKTDEVPESSESAQALCIVGREEFTFSPYLILPPNEDSAIQQIYYEDEQSLNKKFELAKKYELGGVAFWAIGYEEEGALDGVAQYMK